MVVSYDGCLDSHNMIEREILDYLKGINNNKASFEEIKRGVRLDNNSQLVLFHLRNLVERGEVKKVQVGETFYYSLAL